MIRELGIEVLCSSHISKCLRKDRIIRGWRSLGKEKENYTEGVDRESGK